MFTVSIFTGSEKHIRSIVVYEAKCLGLSWHQFYSSEAASCSVHTKKSYSFIHVCGHASVVPQIPICFYCAVSIWFG